MNLEKEWKNFTAGTLGFVLIGFIAPIPFIQGYTLIFVVGDFFAKMTHFIPCKGLLLARETAQIFPDHVFRYISKLFDLGSWLQINIQVLEGSLPAIT